MLKMKRNLEIVSCLVLACFLVAAIIAVQPVSAKEDRKEILVGAHMPLTGFLASAGAEQKWAYEKSVKDINEQGGIFVKEYGKKLPVRLIVADDGSNGMKAASAVERLIRQEKVDCILSGQTVSFGVIPGMIVAERYKKYYHGTVIWIPVFLEHKFKYSTMYFFDIAQGGAMPFDLWNSLPKDQRPKKIGLYIEDSPDGKNIGDGWEKIAAKYGYKVALRVSMGIGAKDFTSQIRQGKAAGVDAILCFHHVPETIALVRQMKENNFSVKYFQGMKGTWAIEFYKALGKDAEYILCDGFWSMDFPYEGAKELGEAFIKDHGRPALSIGLFYAVPQILWAAIEKAGTLDSLKVRQAVLDNEFDTVMGKVKYDKNGVAKFRLADFQWQTGNRELIFPLDVAKSKIEPAPPWNER
jgi:branched-chain amino acid transport system substrate-binding protein